MISILQIYCSSFSDTTSGLYWWMLHDHFGGQHVLCQSRQLIVLFKSSVPTRSVLYASSITEKGEWTSRTLVVNLYLPSVLLVFLCVFWFCNYLYAHLWFQCLLDELIMFSFWNVPLYLIIFLVRKPNLSDINRATQHSCDEYWEVYPLPPFSLLSIACFFLKNI